MNVNNNYRLRNWNELTVELRLREMGVVAQSEEFRTWFAGRLNESDEYDSYSTKEVNHLMLAFRAGELAARYRVVEPESIIEKGDE